MDNQAAVMTVINISRIYRNKANKDNIPYVDKKGIAFTRIVIYDGDVQYSALDYGDERMAGWDVGQTIEVPVVFGPIFKTIQLPRKASKEVTELTQKVVELEAENSRLRAELESLRPKAVEVDYRDQQGSEGKAFYESKNEPVPSDKDNIEDLPF